MTLSFEQACAAATAPGQAFALVDAEIRGRNYRVFENAAATLPEMFSMASLHGDKDFVVYEDERWSFGDVVAQGHTLAAALVADHGVQKGDRVVIAMRNHPEWITSFVGILCAGAIAVPLNAWWTTDELVYGLEDSGAKLAIVDPDRLSRVADHLDQLELTAMVVRSGGTGLEHPRVINFDDVVNERRPPPAIELSADDDATILYTSGTTGASKGAVATHRAHTNAIFGYWCRAAVGAAMAASKKAEESTEGDSEVTDDAPVIPTFILTVPLFHVTGCVPVMLGSFALGAKLVMMHRWDPKRALELIEREQVSTFVGVPTMVQDLLECPEFDQFDTSCLRSIGGGGAPAAPDLVRRVEGTFSKGRPGIGYGMTETTAYGPQNEGDDYMAKPSSTGRAVPMMQIKVIDADGNDLPVGEQGEICFFGPNVIREYWNKPEATADTFVDGWLRSGDLGRIDDDGFVFIEDRVKDLVIRAGENIGCIEVEAAIAGHPAVYEVAVFGLPHERLGEELACSIFPKPGQTVTAEEIQSHVAGRLASFKVPSVVEVSSEMLPRSAQGKILKRSIRDRLTAERADA